VPTSGSPDGPGRPDLIVELAQAVKPGADDEPHLGLAFLKDPADLGAGLALPRRGCGDLLCAAVFPRPGEQPLAARWRRTAAFEVAVSSAIRALLTTRSASPTAMVSRSMASLASRTAISASRPGCPAGVPGAWFVAFR